MSKQTYLPLVFAQDFNLRATSEIVKMAMKRFPLPPGTDKQELINELDSLESDLVFHMVYNPDFFTVKYQGCYPEFHRFIMANKGMNRALFEGSDPCEEWKDMFSMSALVELWRKHKQVYEFDRDFVDALSKTERLRLYPSLLQHLPYKTFYIDFLKIDQFNPYDGMFVHVDVGSDGSLLILGHRVSGQVFYTCRTILSQDMQEEENGMVYYDYKKDRLPRNKEIHIPESIGRHLGISERTVRNENFPDIWMFLMQALTYLSSSVPDVEENPVQKKLYRPTNKVRDKYTEIQKWDVGVRYGTKIRKMESDKKENSGTEASYIVSQLPGKARRSPRPHSRCAHWHHYWTGPGRKKLELRWIEPSFVGDNKKIDTVKHKVSKEAV